MSLEKTITQEAKSDNIASTLVAIIIGVMLLGGSFVATQINAIQPNQSGQLASGVTESIR